MTYHTHRYTAIILLLFSTLACDSSDEPATPAQKENLQELIQSASLHLQESKRFGKLLNPHIPTVDTGADFYSTKAGALQYIGDSIVATLRNDSAEILFTFSVEKDSATRKQREAFVYMVKDSGKWNGAGAFLVDESER